ncbi:MAG: TonB-dependent receptor [Burkholderiales bacterium]|nr:TonB-dependent receptor [Burkholderiales bacterium]MDE1927664.1 TonB-dependent receptor [Burkholderiales bacterium]MDE2158081.1 TonB-dependent receptor [Burkholderiales bacterium]MDE2504140.1 TonB-dependent receptor [Burkholderiales bacterium]
MPQRRGRASLLAAAAAVVCTAQAQAQAQDATPTIVITATRTATAAFDVPASIDSVSGDELRRGRAQVNVTEGLGPIPGLVARDRENYAQDVQISVRGFGARTSFGISGVRMNIDGIPATMPDGQGQSSNIDLSSVDRIEVLRGPYSALYGNSSGGVIQVFTEEGRGAPRALGNLELGSWGLVRLGAQALGEAGGLSYDVSASRFETQGWRAHAAAVRHLGNAKLAFHPDAATKVTLIANHVYLPQALDPMGLTRAQMSANPRGVDPGALSYNTRKSVDQSQLGFIVERRLGAADKLQATLYGGWRDTTQFQSIPYTTQASVLNPGGLIQLSRQYNGIDLRWTHEGRLLDAGYSLSAGLSYDMLHEHRRGFQNFIGSQLGVLGALRRDEINGVSNTDPYVQANLQLTPRWSLNAGVRASEVRFASHNLYLLSTLPADYGSATYRATLPVLGAMFDLSARVHLYANYGRGFETPTLNQLAYRPSGVPGLNFALQSSHSNNVEIGVKARPAGWGHWTAALFQTDSNQEIVTQSSSNGRSVFQNASATQRRGFELGWEQRWFGALRAQLAYTLLDAHYSEAFLTCTASPCATPNVPIAAGKQLPGTGRQTLYAGLAWAPASGWQAGLETRAASRVWVNDLNSDAAGGYGIAAAHIGYVARFEHFEIDTLARVDNLFDRRYVGSVIVGDANGRYFEPSPGRSWLGAVTLRLAF